MPAETLFPETERLRMDEAIDLTVDSINAYANTSDHWAVSWSGGKDSTATLTLIMHLMDEGRVPRPKRFTVLYADTRQELPPLYASALEIMAELRGRGVEVIRCVAPMERRFLPYMLGRGVPPPNNNTLRWCTRQIKLDPMRDELVKITSGNDAPILSITGVRQGESAIRDRRIVMSCGLDGAECGQGWFQEALPNAKGLRGKIATLAPLLHWRVCHVWDWLRIYCPHPDYGGFKATGMIADAYGGDEAEEINSRTGCIGCPLAAQDQALSRVVKMEKWAYLDPLMRLKPLYRKLREPQHRLRKAEAEILKDGSMASNPQRMGPLTLDARRMALDTILRIQDECNAASGGMPAVDILNEDESAFIRRCIEAEQWPDGWSGDEPRADRLIDKVYADGSTMSTLGLELQ